METFTASELPTDVFLPGLGDGYVVEVEQDVDCRAFSGTYNVAIGNYTVVTFHDSDGEECYMLLTPECALEVQR